MSDDASWLECLSREGEGSNGQVFGFAFKDQIDEPIGRALVVIRQRYGEKLSLAYLAEIAGLSSYHFCRVFQRQVGMSPIKFLSLVRMQRAKYLLESSTLSVTEITHQVGYGSVTTFTTRFSAMFGVAPNRLRRQHARKLQRMTGSAVGESQGEITGGEMLDVAGGWIRKCSDPPQDMANDHHAPRLAALSHRADEFMEQAQEAGASGGSQSEATWSG